MVRKQGMRTELKKVKDPNKKVFSRRNYYTDISYIIDEIEISHAFKIDTGSPYTVVGLKHPAVAMVKDIVLDSTLKDITAYDATNSEINLKCFVVENFKLTKDIIFPRIKIHFTEKLDDKCILGMDILSIFDFHYKKDSIKTRSGTFWINDYEYDMKWLENHSLNSELDYIDPDLILYMN